MLLSDRPRLVGRFVVVVFLATAAGDLRPVGLRPYRRPGRGAARRAGGRRLLGDGRREGHRHLGAGTRRGSHGPPAEELPRRRRGQLSPVLQLPADQRIRTVTGYLDEISAMLRARFADSRLAAQLGEQIREFTTSGVAA